MTKILIALDLDGTHFVDLDSADNNNFYDSWIGGSSLFWTDMYAELVILAASKGVEALFAVVTKKRFFDNVSEIAADVLKPFLKINNPKMYTISNGRQYCLVNDKEQLKYECLGRCHSFIPKLTEACSHFEVISQDPSKPKSEAIRRIASFYEIPLDLTLLLDDTPAVLDEAESAGIRTISFQCFNKFELYRIGHEKIKDPTYVNENLQRIKKEIFAKVENMITAALEMENEAKTEITRKPSESISDAPDVPLLQRMHVDPPVLDKIEFFEEAKKTGLAKEKTTPHKSEAPAPQRMEDTISKPNTPPVNQTSFWSPRRAGAVILGTTAAAMFSTCRKLF